MDIFLHSYGDFVCNKQWEVRDDIPLFSRVYYIIDGDSYYYCGDEKIKLDKGHLYIFPQKVKYSILQNKLKCLKTLYFHITTSVCIDNMIDYILNDDEKALLSLLRLNIEKNRNYIELLLKPFLYNALNNVEIVCNDDIQQVVKFINQNIFTSELSVSGLAKMIFLNESYFIRKFKKNMGITPNQYIINTKLQNIADCINQSNNITKLATKYGFSDYKNFSNLFKKKFKVSPTLYGELKKQELMMSI